MSSTGEIHEYIQNVLEKGDHGENRVIVCNAETLNHALDQHSDRIGALYYPDHKLIGFDVVIPKLRRSSLSMRN